MVGWRMVCCGFKALPKSALTYFLLDLIDRGLVPVSTALINMWYIILCYVYVMIFFTLWSLASVVFIRAEQSLWCRLCRRLLHWRFMAWWLLVRLETAVVSLQWLFRPSACTHTNRVFIIMRLLQCNKCLDSMRQINLSGFQSSCFSMYDYDYVAINKFEFSWVEQTGNGPPTITGSWLRAMIAWCI